MAFELNKVFLAGNLTRNPEKRYLPNSNVAVCEFGIAVNRRFLQNGQERDETCFVDIVVWRNQAESCERFLQKGSAVFVEGRLVYDTWQEKETGKKRSRIRVSADRVHFIGNNRRDENGMQSPDGAPMMEDPTAQYNAPRPQYSSSSPRSSNTGNYTRQQFDSPVQQQPRYQQMPPQQQPMSTPPPMPEDDPLENVDDIPF